MSSEISFNLKGGGCSSAWNVIKYFIFSSVAIIFSLISFSFTNYCFLNGCLDITRSCKSRRIGTILKRVKAQGQQMESLIAVVNEVQDAFSDVNSKVDLDLPQIVVIGSQSAGKSSVLECVVGRDFLPRGSGIVTRVPLILRLFQLSPSQKEEWGEFTHLPGKKIYDFNEIREEIIRQTNVLAGPTSIANKPISLSLYSCHHLNLTLVDLPGLVMNAVAGQPKDIDAQILKLVTHYISSPSTIILAICPANTDIATSQALRMCRELDPMGKRTIGVITKIDLMDKGTDCMKILENQEYHLTHGFIGVVCRGQQSINDRVPMEKSKAEERIFFSKSPVYSSIADRCGVDYLRKKLNGLLLNHIRKCLPDLIKAVNDMNATNLKTLESLGLLEATNLDPGAQILSGIKKFSDDVQLCINGGVKTLQNEVVGGARIQMILTGWFSGHIKSVSVSKNLTDQLILTNMLNMGGIHSSIFPSDSVIYSLVRTNVLSLKAPCLSCISVIVAEMGKIIASSAENTIHFPNLKQEIIRISTDLLQECNKTIIHHVEIIIRAESEYMNTNHPRIKAVDVVSAGGVLSSPSSKNSTEPNDDKVPEKRANEDEAKGNKNREKDAKEREKEAEKEREREKVKEREKEEMEKERERDREKEKKKRKKGNIGSFEAPFAYEKGMLDGSAESIPSRLLMPECSDESEKRTVDTVRRLVLVYFDIAKEIVADQSGKAILLLVVSRFCEDIYSRLISELYSKDKIKELVKESPEREEKRKLALAMASAISKALKTLNNLSLPQVEE